MRQQITLTVYPLGCLLWFLLVARVVVLLNWLVAR